jgi:hypothetical protein
VDDADDADDEDDEDDEEDEDDEDDDDEVDEEEDGRGRTNSPDEEGSGVVEENVGNMEEGTQTGGSGNRFFSMGGSGH